MNELSKYSINFDCIIDMISADISDFHYTNATSYLSLIGELSGDCYVYVENNRPLSYRNPISLSSADGFH